MNQVLGRKCASLIGILLCLSLLLSGCMEDLFTTDTYRQCKSFREEFARGRQEFTKEKVYAKLGRPDGYVTEAEGYASALRVEKERLMEQDVNRWVYEGYERPDPANPFRLIVTFDAAGKCIDVQLHMVAGG